MKYVCRPNETGQATWYTEERVELDEPVTLKSGREQTHETVTTPLADVDSPLNDYLRQVYAEQNAIIEARHSEDADIRLIEVSLQFVGAAEVGGKAKGIANYRADGKHCQYRFDFSIGVTR